MSHSCGVADNNKQTVTQLQVVGDKAVLNIVLRMREGGTELLAGREAILHHQFIDRIGCSRSSLVLLHLHDVTGTEDGVLRHTDEQVARRTNEVGLCASRDIFIQHRGV